jgi:nucleotide-binding universal stress UspA family protein
MSAQEIGEETRWLLPVDDSIWSYYAFHFVKDLIKHNESHRLFILHVSQPYYKVLSYFPILENLSTAQMMESYEAQATSFAQKLLTYYGRMAQQNKINFTLLRARAYRPSDMIVECATRYKVNAVVMGQGGRLNFLKKHISGSNSRECLEQISHSNVMIIKRPREDEMSEETLKSLINDENLNYIYTEESITNDHPFVSYKFRDIPWGGQPINKWSSGTLIEDEKKNNQQDRGSDFQQQWGSDFQQKGGSDFQQQRGSDFQQRGSDFQQQRGDFQQQGWGTDQKIPQTQTGWKSGNDQSQTMGQSGL